MSEYVLWMNNINKFKNVANFRRYTNIMKRYSSFCTQWKIHAYELWPHIFQLHFLYTQFNEWDELVTFYSIRGMGG